MIINKNRITIIDVSICRSKLVGMLIEDIYIYKYRMKE